LRICQLKNFENRSTFADVMIKVSCIVYKTESVCMSVCSLFYMHGHSFAVLHEIWHVEFLYCTDGHGRLAGAARAHSLALHAPGNLELAGSRRNGSRAVST